MCSCLTPVKIDLFPLFIRKSLPAYPIRNQNCLLIRHHHDDARTGGESRPQIRAIPNELEVRLGGEADDDDLRLLSERLIDEKDADSVVPSVA